MSAFAKKALDNDLTKIGEAILIWQYPLIA